jgi:hypothetical protein
LNLEKCTAESDSEVQKRERPMPYFNLLQRKRPIDFSDVIQNQNANPYDDIAETSTFNTNDADPSLKPKAITLAQNWKTSSITPAQAQNQETSEGADVPAESIPFEGSEASAPFVGPIAPTRLEQLEAQYNAKPSLKQRILQAAIPAAGLAIGGLVGGEAGAIGAGSAVSETLERTRSLEADKKKMQLDQINQERALQERQSERQMSLAQAIAQMRQTAAENQLNRENAIVVAKAGRKGEPGVQDLIGPDNKLHKYQYNDKTSKYDIDLGESRQPTARASQLKRGMVNGKPVVANYDTASGKITDAGGNDITADFTPLDSETHPISIDLKGEKIPAVQVVNYDGTSRVIANGQEIKNPKIFRESSININNLTPEGLDIAAEMFAKTGIMPSLGMGSSAMRSAIINRAAQLHPQVDLAGNRASFDANRSSLTQLQRNRDSIVAFENTALKNLDVFLSSAKTVIDSGSPIINRPMRAINEKLLGSPELSALQAARRVAVNEIAKVTSNPNLSGQLSDAARQEVASFIPENATLAQVYAVANILRKDMTSRHQSLDEQIGAIQKRIGGNGEASGGTKLVTGPKAGTVINGYRFKGGNPKNKANWIKE